jgi:two-component system, cell cycle response regulator
VTRRADPALLVLTGGSVGKLFKLPPLTEGARVFLGRAEENDVRLEDETVASRHAFLEQQPGGLVLIDGQRLGGGYVSRSLDGVFLNGARIDRRRLRDGDVITLGATVQLKYLASAGAGEPLVEGHTTKDPLTGVYNKLFWIRRLTTELAAQRTLKQPLAVALLDLDHFKRVNDAHGKPTGDAVLRAVAETIVAQVRPDDVVARYGGEELAILFPNTDARRATIACERVRRAIEGQRVTFGGHELSITASLGVAARAPDDPGVADWAALVRTADERLAKAKETGRNLVLA